MARSQYGPPDGELGLLPCITNAGTYPTAALSPAQNPYEARQRGDLTTTTRMASGVCALRHELPNAGGIRGPTHRLHHGTDDRAGRLNLPSRSFSSTSGCAASDSSIAASNAPSSETTASPRKATTSDGRAPPPDDAFEHLGGETVGEFPGLDEGDEFPTHEEV